jgi:CCR4-NOT transcription complex subunit 2
MTSANASSMWSSSSRNVGGPVQRNQGTPLPSQGSQQDDLFSPSSRLSSAQGSFRFGNQGNAAGQASQNQSAVTDEFPPLSRNANGDIGQERNSGLMSSLGFGSQPAGAASTMQATRAGNGLLNALSANARAADTRSPTTGSYP